MFWLGIAFELFGLLLVSLSDWVSLAKYVGRGARGQLTAAWWKVARVFGKRRTVTGKVSMGGGIALGGSVTGIVSPGEDATLKERVAFLLRQSEQTQRTLGELGSRVAGLPDQWTLDIASAREELQQRIERRLTETQEKYLTARRFGLVSLLVGIALVSWSNL